MNPKKNLAVSLLALVAAVPNAIHAVNVPLDSSNTANGLTEIYSATFDPPLNPTCVPGRLTATECAFFGGQTPVERAITLVPNPTGVDIGAPRGITPQPPDGSFLDLDLLAGNTQVRLNGGVVYIPAADIVIRQGQPDETNIQASDIGIELKNFAPVSVPVDGNGVATFAIDFAPTTVADFSTFSVIVDNCTGSLCGLIPILTLDMLRFRLVIDYDATFGSFTSDFKGQTANNSMVFATLNSGVPAISVTDSVPPAGDQSVPFGNVTEMTQVNRTVTVTNLGTGDLVLGTVTTPAAPFSLPSDPCSGQTLAPAANCVIGVRFAPQGTGAFASSFDIPSNDAASPSVTVSLSGTGTALPVPDITVTDTIPPIDDLDMSYGNVATGTLRDETVTITNDGTGDLNVGSLAQVDALGLPFGILNDTCSLATLTPTSSCTLTVRFEPTAVGSFTDSFDIPSDDPDAPSVTMDVSGTGTSIPMPDIVVTDSIDPDDDLQLPFGDIWEQFTIEETIRIANVGNANLVLGSIAAPAAPFAVVDDPCSGQTIAPTMSCSVDVSFNPTTVASFTDSLDIPSNDPDEPTVTVNFSGNGVPPDPGEKLPNDPSGSDGGFFGLAMDPLALLALLPLIPLVRARRRAGAGD
jgi:hypothetical protein